MVSKMKNVSAYPVKEATLQEYRRVKPDGVFNEATYQGRRVIWERVYTTDQGKGTVVLQVVAEEKGER